MVGPGAASYNASEEPYANMGRVCQLADQKTIVVIDNDPGILNALRRLLSAHGFVVLPFASAESFLDNGSTSSAHCLLLDIQLGGISGLELARKLKESGLSKPVIFMTAFDSELTRREAGQLDCAGYLPKPYSAKTLMDAIGRAGT